MIYRAFTRNFLWLCIAIFFVSFQPSQEQAVSVNNIGVSNETPIKLRFQLQEGDLIKLGFKSGDNQVPSGNNISYDLFETQNQTIAEGNISNSRKSIPIKNSGNYLLTIKSSNKKEAFLNLNIEKTKGKWTSSGTPVELESGLIQLPKKNNPQTGIKISWPVAKGGKYAINAGDGKNAKALSVYIEQTKETVQLDKGFSTQMKNDGIAEIIVYLDEESLKKNGLLETVSSLFSKKKPIDFSKLAGINFSGSEAPKLASSGTSSSDNIEFVLNNKPSSNDSENADNQKSEADNSPKENFSRNDLRDSLIYEALINLKQPTKIMLEGHEPLSKTMDLPCIFDLSINEKNKRKCIPFPVKPAPLANTFFGLWLSVNVDINSNYIKTENNLKNRRGDFNTLLFEFSNVLYEKLPNGQTEELFFNPTSQIFPVYDTERSSLNDNFEVAILTGNQKEMFESNTFELSAAATSSTVAGQIFVFGPSTIVEPLFICACNKNKISPLKLFYKIEEFNPKTI